MREIIFRGKIKDSGEWVSGRNILQTQNEYGVFIVPTETPIAGLQFEETNFTTMMIPFYGVIPETVGQFTGLYDDTKWEDLTDTEKENFYNSVKSEDGITFKYDSIEKVKRLWKGKPIFEGDIVECISSDGIGKSKIDTIKVKDMTDYNTMVYLNCSNELRYIGNIHDNPELLEVQDND